MIAGRNRILVTGGATFIGKYITAALLAEGASVRLLVRPGGEVLMGDLINEVEWYHGDVWNPASLKGHGRGVSMVIHTVGGTKVNPAKGLTYHYLNVLSLRNIANMCVTDGVPHYMFISVANALWLPRAYVDAKREAETYMERIGLDGTVIRAPLLYERNKSRSFVYRTVSLMARLTPFFYRSAPMPVDIFARGVARLAMMNGGDKARYFANDLKRLNTRDERRGTLPIKPDNNPIIEEPPPNEADTKPTVPLNLSG